MKKIRLNKTPKGQRTYSLCLDAVKQDKMNIRYVPAKHKTEELIAQIKQYGGVLKFIPHKFKTYEMCMDAVKRGWYDLKYVPKKYKTLGFCLSTLVVPVDGSNIPLSRVESLRYIPRELKTKEFWYLAVAINIWVFPEVPDECKTEELCKMAVAKFGWFIKYVPDELITGKLYRTAVFDSKSYLHYISKKVLERLLTYEIWRDITNPDVEKIEEILKAGVNVNAHVENDGSYLISEIDRLNCHLYHSNEDWRKYGSTADASRVAFYNNYPNLDLRIVKLLLQYGADVNHTDEYHVCPLYFATYVPIPELFELLLEHGADPNCKDENGYTVLDQAYSEQSGIELLHGNVLASEKLGEIIEILKKHGAKCAVLNG